MNWEALVLRGITVVKGYQVETVQMVKMDLLGNLELMDQKELLEILDYKALTELMEVWGLKGRKEQEETKVYHVICNFKSYMYCKFLFMYENTPSA